MSKPMASRLIGIGPSWFDRRQMGFKNPLGTTSHIYEQMYSNILPCGCWEHSLNNAYTSAYGGVFSLEFSPEGSLLVAACEKRSVLLFDPLTHKRIHTVENAHLDCVNCIKFLDSRSFATCSDDFTVALWDSRNLSQKVRSLKGHSNWVKNIGYAPKDGLLVTSGFDGNILTWDMNKYTEEGVVHNKIFSTNGLMRTCLTPDASKMIMCNTGGYLIIIHNLDLNTLSRDLYGFKPNMYRLMQLSQTILPVASEYTHLFRGHGKRNRLEFVADFPEGDDAEVVSSLQIHPDGHSAISRNVSNNEESEWSCIHNIEERLSSDESDYGEEEDDDTDGCKTVTWPGRSTSISTTPTYIIQHASLQPDQILNTFRGGVGLNSEQRDLSVSPSDVWEALVAIQEARIRRETDRMTSEMSVGHMFRRQAIDAGIQVRPLNSQIFVTRIMPNMGSSRIREEQSPTIFNRPPSVRRNVSINTQEAVSRSSHQRSCRPVPRNSRQSVRKKFPLRQRYTSLYRRSLVGRYDRTSILRKPIYYPKMKNVKIKKSKENIQLNTNYELNETRRLQNDLGSRPHSGNFNGERGENQPVIASGSQNHVGEDTTPPVRRRVKTNSHRNASQETVEGELESLTVSSALNSWRENLSSIENNLNSFRETIANLEGSLNLALRRVHSDMPSRNEMSRDEGQRNASHSIASSVNASLSVASGINPSRSNTSCNNTSRSGISGINASSNNTSRSDISGINANDTNTNRSHTSAINGIRSNGNFVNTTRNIAIGCSSRISNASANNGVFERAVSRAGSDSIESTGRIGNHMEFRNRNENAHHEEAVNSRSSRNGEPPNEILRTSSRPVVSSNSNGPMSTNGERTILMGVFRAGNDEGGRGTSMRRHNVAAVTVSSPPQRTADASTSIDTLQPERTRTRHSHNSKNQNNINCSTKNYPAVPVNKRIYQNTKRLTHYVEEPNLGRGFIKELCVSPDGRIICSPFGNGIRLLSFSPTVQDIFHCYPPSPPIPLHELTLNIAHTDIVVSTKFSPFHNLLVSGCLSGKIVYYQPFL